jgi:hypothetical protein
VCSAADDVGPWTEPSPRRSSSPADLKEPVRSLDAIHLASLRALDHELGGFEVASCDDRVRRNAIALGFAVAPERG